MKQLLKKILSGAFLLSAIAGFIMPAATALALEATYPTLSIPGIPGGITITSSTTIIQYFQYFFIFLIVSSGIIAVISIVFYGLKILLTAGDVGAIGEAKQNILSSVFGIALLLFAFIILQTINPELVSPATYASLRPGVYYMSDNNATPATTDNPNGLVFEQARDSVDNTGTIPTPFTKIYYNCAPGGRRLLVWTFNDFLMNIDRAHNGDPNVTTRILACNGNTPDADNTLILNDPQFPILSFEWAYEDAGVYFYLKDDCTGISSYVKKESGIIQNYDNQAGQDQTTKCVRIVNSTSQKYGVVLENIANGYGCSAAILVPNQQVGAFNSNSNAIKNKWPDQAANANLSPPTYADILNLTPYVADSRRSIDLRSNLLKLVLTDNNIGAYFIYPATLAADSNVDKLLKDNGSVYQGSSPAPAAECDPASSTTCLKEIRPTGRYYVILHTKNRILNDSKTCRIYTQRVNLSTTDISNSNEKIYYMEIIPRK